MNLKLIIRNDNGYSREVEPSGDLIVSGSRADREFYYENSIGSLKLIGDDYYDLIQFEESFDDFYLDFYCNNILIFEGIFSFLNANICKDECSIELDIEENSPMNCLIRNSEEVNVLSIPATIVESEIPELQNNLEFYATRSDLSPPDPTSWGLHSVIQITWNACFLNVYDVNIWAREKVAGYCVGGSPDLPSGAILLNDNCSIDGTFEYAVAYSGSVTNYPALNLIPTGDYGCFKFEIDGISVPSNYTQINQFIVDNPVDGSNPSCDGVPEILETLNFYVDFECLEANNPLTGNKIPNARRVDEIILHMIQQTGCGVNCYESEFFNDPINYVTGQPNKLNDLFYHEMSDVTRPTASQSATISEISLIELYENLKETFNLIHRVNSNGCYEIEHVQKVYENIVNLEDLGDVIKNPCCYTVNKEEIPKYEKWKWNEADNIDFVGRNIEYKKTSGDYLTKTDPETHDNSNLSTDIEYVYAGYNRANNPVNNLDGWVLTYNFFNGSQYVLGSDIGALTGSAKLNGHLSQANLHDNYWRDYRYYKQGFLNSQLVTFDSTRPLKENEEVIITACCDGFNNLDIEYKLINIDGCGLGIIESYDFNAKTGQITLNISLI